MLVVDRADAVIGDLMIKVYEAWAPSHQLPLARGVRAELGWVA